MRPLALAVLTAAGVFLTACSDGAPPTRPVDAGGDRPSLRRLRIAVDGVLTPEEWGDAAFASFGATGPEGAINAAVRITHDNRYLYASVLASRRSFHANDFASIRFDNDNDGIQEDGDDVLLGSASPAVELEAGDWHRYTEPGGVPGGGSSSDVARGGTNDGQIGFAATANSEVWEWRHELNSADNPHDFSITPTPTQTVGFLVQLSLYDAGTSSYIHTIYPASGYCALTIGPANTTSITC